MQQQNGEQSAGDRYDERCCVSGSFFDGLWLHGADAIRSMPLDVSENASAPPALRREALRAYNTHPVIPVDVQLRCIRTARGEARKIREPRIVGIDVALNE